MKVYAAIGHYKADKNLTCVALTQNTKKDFMRDCYGNDFVPYVVLTEQAIDKLAICASSDEVFDMVKKMTSNHRVWNDVTDYIDQCFDILTEKVGAAKRAEPAPVAAKREKKAMTKTKQVLDGRKDHEVPKVIELSSFIIASKWIAEDFVGELFTVYDLLLDGMHVPCVSSKDKRYGYILCGEYKTESGFIAWLARTYHQARRAA